MGLTKLNGIVLNSFEINDYDKVVTFFSDKYGKQSFIALGVNKPESKNKYSLLTFNFSEFEIFKSNRSQGLSKLKTGSIIKTNFNISQNYDSYLYASAINSVILYSTEFNQKNFRLFKRYCFFLEKINTNASPFLSFTYFLLDSIKDFGGLIMLDKCYRCKKNYKIYRSFDFNEYGMICPNCWTKNDMIIDSNFLSFLSTIGKQTFDEMFENQHDIIYLIILSKVLIEYYENILGIFNYSLKLIKEKKIYSPEVFNNYTYSVLTKV